MDEELYLTDLISVDVLQKLQDAFSEMTGMAALTADKYGVAVTKGSNFSEFCDKYTRKSPLGNSRCMNCDKTGAELTMQTGKACSYYCHAGLVDYAAPIIFGDKMVGSFIGGQVLPNPPDMEKIEKTAIELGINPEEYKAAAGKINILPNETIQKAADFLSVVANALSMLAFQSYELKKSNEEIEKASHMKSDFLANMSHEIRTPMNAVLGMVDLALREEMSPAAKNYIHQIKSSAKNLLVIINDILDFSKIESGKMDIISVAYEPLSLINDLASIVNSRIGNKKVEFTIDISPEMPKMIFGDNVRIHQILLNLITNAIKFTKQGEVHLTIDFAPLDSETVLLKASVKDTGMGIKKENFKKLFNSFQQVDSKRNRNIEGTGLGLAISKQLLALMNGKISVESEYGKGSNFFFELPQKIIDNTPAIPNLNDHARVGIFVSNCYVREQLIKDIERIGAEPIMLEDEGMENNIYEYIVIEKIFFSPSMREYLTAHPDVKCIVIVNFDAPNDIDFPNVNLIHKPIYSLSLYNAMGISDFTIGETTEVDSFTFVAPEAHILIVDDNTVNLTVAKGLIEPVEMIVDTAESAAEAIEKVGRVKYDLIFMDHMMPEVDGVEATHIIRRMFPSYSETPIIALTANAVGDAKAMFLKEGMNDFVAKPIDVKDIISKLRKWLPQDKILPIEANRISKLKDDIEESDLPKIEGLNVENSISLLGSEKLFWSVLEEYYNSIDKKSSSIRKHYESENWKEYTIEVHALKSTSRQIGAEAMGEIAAELEKAGKENNIQFIKEKNDYMLDEYIKFKDILAPIFGKKNDGEESKYADNEKILALLDEMLEALNDFDILQIDDVMARMEGFEYAEKYMVYYDALKQSVADSDIDRCFANVNEWKYCINTSPSKYNHIRLGNDAVLKLLDNLQTALNNFDILKIDEAVVQLEKHQYPKEQIEFLKQIGNYAQLSDIDGCCEIVAKWKALLL